MSQLLKAHGLTMMKLLSGALISSYCFYLDAFIVQCSFAEANMKILLIIFGPGWLSASLQIRKLLLLLLLLNLLLLLLLNLLLLLWCNSIILHLYNPEADVASQSAAVYPVQ